MEAPVKTISVDLYDEDIRALDEIAKRRGTSRTEALRGAIATEKFLRELFDRGAELYSKEKGSNTLNKLTLQG